MIWDIICAVWRQGIPCLFHLYTGLYCPGCGGTRAVKALIRGDLLLSFRYHPLILYMVTVVVVQIVTWLLAKLLKKPSFHIKHYLFFVYLGIGIGLVNVIVKNYMLLVHGIDLLP